jgi:hypothetical protein
MVEDCDSAFIPHTGASKFHCIPHVRGHQLGHNPPNVDLLEPPRTRSERVLHGRIGFASVAIGTEGHALRRATLLLPRSYAKEPGDLGSRSTDPTPWQTPGETLTLLGRWDRNGHPRIAFNRSAFNHLPQAELLSSEAMNGLPLNPLFAPRTLGSGLEIHSPTHLCRGLSRVQDSCRKATILRGGKVTSSNGGRTLFPSSGG